MRAARIAAEEALVQIEGSLILSRLIKAPGPFRRALARLPAILLPEHPASGR